MKKIFLNFVLLILLINSISSQIPYFEDTNIRKIIYTNDSINIYIDISKTYLNDYYIIITNSTNIGDFSYYVICFKNYNLFYFNNIYSVAYINNILYNSNGISLSKKEFRSIYKKKIKEIILISDKCELFYIPLNKSIKQIIKEQSKF